MKPIGEEVPFGGDGETFGEEKPEEEIVMKPSEGEIPWEHFPLSPGD